MLKVNILNVSGDDIMSSMHKTVILWLLSITGLLMIYGCSGSKSASVPQETFKPNRDLALSHFLAGSTLDQKEDYAAAILEYQEALLYDHDPAVYYALSKDYALLSKNEMAIRNGKEAVTLDPDKKEYRNNLAEIYLRAFQFDNAEKEYNECIRVDSTNRQAWYTLGRLLQLTKPQTALEFYQKFIDYFGPDLDIDAQMAQIYSVLGKTDKLISVLKDMLVLDSDNSEVKKSLADVYLQTDSVDSALSLYTEVVQDQPHNFLVRASLAHAYLLKHDNTKAAEQVQAVMKDSLSLDEQLQFGQAFVSVILKDSTVAPLAMDLFQKIKKENPGDWRSYWFIGSIANITHDDSTALIYFQKVTELAAWNVDGWVAIASMYYDAGKFDRAISVMEDAEKHVPNEYRVYFLLGISQQRLHNDVEAARALEHALSLNDKNVDIFSSLGLVYDEMDRHQDSDSMYERALRIDSHNHLVLNNYGYSLSERNIQLDRALSMSEEALRQQPDNQSYLDTKGWINYQLGRYEEAEAAVRRAIELGSKSPVIAEHLGDIYSKLNEKEKALEYWKKAAEYGGTSPSLKEKIQRGRL
jgi:tetratricopeptide (TPR) repeat protein